MPISLLYHDVVAEGQYDASGFPGAGAARYKLTLRQFRSHMDAIAAAGAKPLTIRELPPVPVSPLMLTFDDGGLSAYLPIADILEHRGWRGHFFMTVDCINAPRFLTAGHLRELHARGHVIGTHSCSHPARMSHCTWNQLLHEWQHSRDVLADVLGEPVTVGSVPGGYYSPTVARAAARAGLHTLFTSEPIADEQDVNGCLVLGRYTVYRGMSPRAAAALARGRLLRRSRQYLAWNLKKLAKSAGGHTYLNARTWLLGQAYSQ